MNQVHYEQVDKLTSKVLDEIASSSEISELERLICSNPNLRKRYSHLILQESLLHWETSDGTNFAEEEVLKPKLISFPLVASIAASVVAIFGGWLLNVNFKSNDGFFTESIAQSTTPSIFSDNNAKLIGEYDSNQRKSNSKSLLSLDLSRIIETTNLSIATRGIETLEKEIRFDSEALVRIHDKVRSWSRAEHLSVPAENGVLPYDGNDMIKLSEPVVDVDLQISRVQETLQVLDVREMVQSDGTRLFAEVFLNKGISNVSDSTKYLLSIHALEGEVGMDKKELDFASTSLIADTDQFTWEKLTSEFIIPENADFLLVSLTATTEGAEALLPHQNEHYADALRVNLKMPGGNTIGPL